MKFYINVFIIFGMLYAQFDWQEGGAPIRQGIHIEWQRTGDADSDGSMIYAWSDCRNGIRDVIKFHGEYFYRIKLGIKNELYKKKNIKSEYFVLDKFDLNERKVIECFKRKCNKNFEFMVKKKFSLLNFN